ncbi:MAG: GNAT family N-acetyltransferase [Candidatus Hydrogenedentes bacterium]|nr:GNAT family N-acetyltransferase [Candidatus Hydrogenedentota bacterium]
MNAAIRPARAEDAAAAAPLIYSSGPEAFEYVFSHRARTPARGFIEYAFSRGAGEFSWRWFRVVEVDGQVAGTASGYTGADARGFAWHAVRQIVHCNGLLAGARVIARGLRIERIIVPPSRPDEYYIGNVAIAPDLRGRGLGRMLFEHLHEEARARGASECVLDVSAENPRAEALYARLGYQVVRDIPSRLANAAGRVPDHRRMALSL